MRKNDLIQLLQGMPGNPEVVLWNGFVEDVQPIHKHVVPVKLHKLSFEGYKERINIDRQVREAGEPLDDATLCGMYKQHGVGDWELLRYYPPSVGDKWYKTKTVLVLEPKLTGKSTFDRNGRIDY